MYSVSKISINFGKVWQKILQISKLLSIFWKHSRNSDEFGGVKAFAKFQSLEVIQSNWKLQNDSKHDYLYLVLFIVNHFWNSNTSGRILLNLKAWAVQKYVELVDSVRSFLSESLRTCKIGFDTAEREPCKLAFSCFSDNLKCSGIMQVP